MKEPNHSKRKSEHIDIVLNRKVTGTGITTGFETYRFIHQALPEIAFSDISLETDFLGKRLKAPFLISSMTGGTKKARRINRNLASAAEARGWAMGLGSVRAALEHPETADTFNMREVAPSIPLLANLGAVQLNYGYGVDHCRRAVEVTKADALILHLNSLQEVFQPGGNTDFRNLLQKIEDVASALEVPVGVKEVGWGIHGELARRLFDAGVAFVDVAGAGGTSWSQVEKYRSRDELRFQAARAFEDWGLPTADCLRDVRSLTPEGTLIASGGLKDGVEGAKALALGANLAGYGRSLLRPATEPAEEAITRQLERIELECKITMFATGIDRVEMLKGTKRIVKKERADR
ncbi:isopentenyl-diphosphate delta-isomerase [Melghirimyces profundicolus]|uniref:Isopentenyl-diphosphate delta-isomerase n=1 Tax=Melghirimyces profundicolus TaxID=1242148 RepID=A0A2T6C4N4_9BACL|nr:type 2 isopentenyl-diphosphate Delta-isomerase [Melghirimyces profundicolus]PTX63284.1 isopentenyl-diphosphate delta-isomerase [Melghirimyces profundicolus]